MAFRGTMAKSLFSMPRMSYRNMPALGSAGMRRDTKATSPYGGS